MTLEQQYQQEYHLLRLWLKLNDEDMYPEEWMQAHADLGCNGIDRLLVRMNRSAVGAAYQSLLMSGEVNPQDTRRGKYSRMYEEKIERVLISREKLCYRIYATSAPEYERYLNSPTTTPRP